MRCTPLAKVAVFVHESFSSNRPAVDKIQMFWVMVQQWLGRSSSPTDCRLLFFEECAIAVKNRLAGAVVPWKDSGDGASAESGGGDRGDEDDDDDGSAGRRRRR